MLDPSQLTVHALTLRQLASAEQVAEVTGQPLAEVEAAPGQGRGRRRVVVAARGSYMISPAGRAAARRGLPAGVRGAARRPADHRGHGLVRDRREQAGPRR